MQTSDPRTPGGPDAVIGPLRLGLASVTVQRHREGPTIVHVAGQLDLSNGDQFAKFISSNDVVADSVLVDFSGIEFVGMSALSSLAEMAATVTNVNWSLVTAPALDHVMVAGGFATDSRCFSTVDAALASSVG